MSSICLLLQLRNSSCACERHKEVLHQPTESKRLISNRIGNDLQFALCFITHSEDSVNLFLKTKYII
jgi:hypothetical protein